MNKLIISIIVIFILAVGIGTFFVFQTPAFPAPTQPVSQKLLLSKEELGILAGANERIEKYRKAPAVLNIVTEDGKPATHVAVTIEQQEHEFLFGLGTSDVMGNLIAAKKYGAKIPKDVLDKYSISEKEMDAYEEKFFSFANNTALPVRWIVYENKEGVIDYSSYDAAINDMHKYGVKVLAHSLVWNNNTPNWVPSDCNELNQAIEKRVRDFLAHYKSKFDYFLLVNEAANPFRAIFKNDKMTRCIKEMGKREFVARAFKIARETSPTAKLMINEVSISENQGFPELLKSLRNVDSKPLFDVIGIQSHMHEKLWTLDDIWKTAEGYSKFGVPIQFTEVTVLSGTPISGKNYGMKTTPEGEKLQAEHAVNLYTVLFSHPAVEGIMWWNLTDLGSWKNAPAGLLRSDMSSKPAYSALKDLIKKKWWTKIQAKTNDNGRVEFSGFFGKYKVTVTPENGQPRIYNIELLKAGKRDFELKLYGVKH